MQVVHLPFWVVSLFYSIQRVTSCERVLEFLSETGPSHDANGESAGQNLLTHLPVKLCNRARNKPPFPIVNRTDTLRTCHNDTHVCYGARSMMPWVLQPQVSWHREGSCLSLQLSGHLNPLSSADVRSSGQGSQHMELMTRHSVSSSSSSQSPTVFIPASNCLMRLTGPCVGH